MTDSDWWVIFWFDNSNNIRKKAECKTECLSAGQ